ncbi:MAG: hypothetical protein J2P17_33275 [Mycobacterium sp.]|nr:hypothetical protein [Mycobacterium sp.]
MNRISGTRAAGEGTDDRSSSRSVGASPDPQAARIGRARGWLAKCIIPLSATGCYALFALAVHFGMLDSLDLAVRKAAHVGEVWGPVQIRAARIVDDLAPPQLAVALFLFAAVIGIVRRSLRPLFVVALVGLPTAMVTLGTKWVMAHWNPGAPPLDHGSFPSGHTVSVIVVFGLFVAILRPATRWGWVLPAVMGCLMGTALVLAWVHPATDVIGGGLLALAALTGAQAAQLGRWACAHQRA